MKTGREAAAALFEVQLWGRAVVVSLQPLLSCALALFGNSPPLCPGGSPRGAADFVTGKCEGRSHVRSWKAD